MSKERELLRRFLAVWDADADCADQGEVYLALDSTVEDIRAFLAAEQEAEPVFIRPDHLAMARKSPFLCQVGPVQVADFVPLYVRPEPSRKPMSEEEIYHSFEPDVWAGGYRFFVEGVRWAEKHHGIGEDDE